ncbi:hypothetical protein AAIE21_25190 [Paenibacillus sp. 102]
MNSEQEMVAIALTIEVIVSAVVAYGEGHTEERVQLTSDLPFEH